MFEESLINIIKGQFLNVSCIKFNIYFSKSFQLSDITMNFFFANWMTVPMVLLH
jgi:hypothetical protein